MKPTPKVTHTASKASQVGSAHYGEKKSAGTTPVLKENPKGSSSAPTSHHGTPAPKFATNHTKGCDCPNC